MCSRLRVEHGGWDIGGVTPGKFCPDRESNPDLRFRKPPFYPLNYRGEERGKIACGVQGCHPDLDSCSGGKRRGFCCAAGRGFG